MSARLEMAPHDEPRCFVCGSGRSSLLLRAANGFPIQRCADCGVAFTDDRDAPPASSLYPAFDQTSSNMLTGVRSALSVFLRRREAVVRSLKPSGRLLDFGCGGGAFARWMAGRGYDVVGLEPFSLDEPITSDHLTLLRAPLEDVEASLGTFDVITLWQVLEHLRNPVQVLERLRRHLRPDGVLLVSVPNLRSWQSELFRGRWFHLDPPRHLIHFDPDTLRACLERAGLSVIGERRFLSEYGTSGWTQSVLNRLLPHQNYLYELIKDRGALAGLSAASSAAHLAASLLIGGPVLALTWPLEAVASAARGGAAVTYVARAA
jgi:SAM-dependent methyltransferase